MESQLSRYCCLYLLLFSVISIVSPATSGDSEALLALKSSIDPSNSLPWPQGNDVCKWQGIKECMNGRVTKLVLEYLNLTGTLDGKTLNQLDQLRVLSFKGNSISGQIPNLSALVNLKSLFLNDNNFSGEFPDSITSLHRLKVVVLAENQISGPIPQSVLRLTRLYVLHLQNNKFTGEIPPLSQTSLRFFNVSNNKLSGQIPVTPALIRFNTSSFSGNVDLCGEQIKNPCNNSDFSPSASPSSPRRPSSKHSSNSKRSRLIKIITASVGGFLLLCVVCLLAIYLIRKSCNTQLRSRSIGERGIKGKGVAGGGDSGGGGSGGDGSGMGGNNGRTQGGFSWEREGLGTLVFLGAGDQQMSYSLEDLLKASAETLGRGTIGSTYKAVMESGFIVTVKRLKEARYPRVEEFRRHMELLGRLRHPHLVPLRAYFQAKEERLLVYDYFPNGSLFSLLHGTRTSGGGKPLHWTSCLKIAEDLATGLLYIHQNPGLTHGNLKSSNVLLGPEFESCLTDYGLTIFRDPDLVEEPSATCLFYRAPENRDNRKPSTQQADVYSFGVLLLELLTGKTPFQDLVQEHGSDIPRWVRSVREEETESGDEPASLSGNEAAAEDKLAALVNVAMACVSIVPDNRPSMRDVLKMIRDSRGDVQVSSNSSDHSPGRWSDTVQSLPREEHLSI
ncbi:inactive leucine-rich repeat receptor-like serine/threonine-protein kinase At1g60630 [Euphorbia lathyris]|uniref:inactive leucine-rich repeat receptor-like serine/threonine-protein kinase At1g60630 n=1 Tax=Euphorbia lathyris TaxID=212925 RepID=UPI00331342D5